MFSFVKFHEFYFHGKVYDPIHMALRFVSYVTREKCACNSSRARVVNKNETRRTPLNSYRTNIAHARDGWDM